MILAEREEEEAELKTSKEWEKLVPPEAKLKILDADGWDRTNFDYSFNEELITKEEFLMRVSNSTISIVVGFIDKM
jgi:hypothetical protein